MTNIVDQRGRGCDVTYSPRYCDRCGRTLDALDITFESAHGALETVALHGEAARSVWEMVERDARRNAK